MAKFIRIIVNLCIICFLLTGAALIVPQFVGITTVIVDDDITESNVNLGSVVYGKSVKLSKLGVGDKLLRYGNASVYVSGIKSVDSTANVYTVEGKDGSDEEVTLRTTGEKALLTVPFIGYVSIAMQTVEGRIILGLALLLLIILFILSEIWKNNREDEEEQEVPLDKKERRVRRKAEKRRQKREQSEPEEEAEETPAQMYEQLDETFAPESVEEDPPAPAEELILESVKCEEETPEEAVTIPEPEQAEGSGEAEPDDLTAAIQTALEQEVEMKSDEQKPKTAAPETQTEVSETQTEVSEAAAEPNKPGKLAIPVLTAEELLERAAMEGDAPKVVEDKEDGITFVDYSDVL